MPATYATLGFGAAHVRRLRPGPRLDRPALPGPGRPRGRARLSRVRRRRRSLDDIAALLGFSESERAPPRLPSRDLTTRPGPACSAPRDPASPDDPVVYWPVRTRAAPRSRKRHEGRPPRRRRPPGRPHGHHRERPADRPADGGAGHPRRPLPLHLPRLVPAAGDDRGLRGVHRGGGRRVVGDRAAALPSGSCPLRRPSPRSCCSRSGSSASPRPRWPRWPSTCTWRSSGPPSCPASGRSSTSASIPTPPRVMGSIGFGASLGGVAGGLLAWGASPGWCPCRPCSR